MDAPLKMRTLLLLLLLSIAIAHLAVAGPSKWLELGFG